MMLRIHLALLSLLALTSTCLAAVISSPVRLAAWPSSSNSTLDQADSNVLVDPKKYPQWAGDMDSNDCITAWNMLEVRVRPFPQNLPIMFWSQTFSHRPFDYPNRPLPFGTTFGTCTLLFRMGRDFGDNVLPLIDGFLQASGYEPAAIFSWTDALSAMSDLLKDVVEKDLPGWSHAEHNGMYAIIAYMPVDSFMAVTWTADMKSLRSPVGNTLLSKHSKTQLVNGSFPTF